MYFRSGGFFFGNCKQTAENWKYPPLLKLILVFTITTHGLWCSHLKLQLLIWVTLNETNFGQFWVSKTGILKILNFDFDKFQPSESSKIVKIKILSLLKYPKWQFLTFPNNQNWFHVKSVEHKSCQITALCVVINFGYCRS